MNPTPKIYIVDERSVILRSLEANLIAHGFSVQTYASAEAFLNAYQPSDLGCLLVDLQLPGMRGNDLWRGLYDQSGWLSVIVITGSLEPELPSPFDEYAVPILQEPYDVQTMLKLVREGITASVNRADQHRRESC